MGRNVKIPEHYNADANYLERLKRRIERDLRFTPKQKRDMMEALNTVVVYFLDDYRARISAESRDENDRGNYRR